jgi:hypothetical protein
MTYQLKHKYFDKANVNQEITQAIIQPVTQENEVFVATGDGGGGGDGGDGAAGGGGGGGVDAELIALLAAELPPGQFIRALELLVGDDDGAGGAGGEGGAGGDGGDGGDVGFVIAVNVNVQDAANIAEQDADVGQEQEDIEVEQEQDAGIGQLNLAGLDAFA